MRIKFILSLLFLSGILAMSSCKEDITTPEFNRTALLENAGNSIILPFYKELRLNTDSLHQKAETFSLSPDINSLNDLQLAFKKAWASWQKTEMFEFGPAQASNLRERINSFPANRSGIDGIIRSAEPINQSSVNSNPASQSGFPAIDYLIFDYNDDNNSVLNTFISSPDAARKLKLLLAITENIRDKSLAVYNEWSPEGSNYLNTFINNKGTDVGSSLGFLVNQLNFQLEIILGQKIGVPLGKKSLGQIQPEKTEAYFSKTSLNNIITNLETLQAIFSGTADGNNGSGMDDYLDFLKTDHNGTPLSTVISQKFANAIQAVKQINAPLSVSVVSGKQQVDTAYNELKKLLVNTKVDLPSALGILITYVDNDGD